MTYSATKFEVAMFNRLGGDTFTRNVMDAQTHGRRTNFGTEYPFFLKIKAGINTTALCPINNFPLTLKFFMVFCHLLIFFKIISFKKFFQEYNQECQTVWI